MKTILITVPDYYPKESGVPHVTEYLSEGVSQRDYHVIVATGLIDGLPNEEWHNGVQIRRFDIKGSSLKKPYGETEQYKEWISEQNPDVIVNVCKTVWSTTLVLNDVAKKNNCKRILFSHGAAGLYYDHCFRRGSSIKHFWGYIYRHYVSKIFFRVYLPKYLPSYDKIICLSKECGREYPYFKKYVEENKIFELGNAADDMFFNNTETDTIKKYLDTKTKYCVCVANFTDVKNHALLLKEYYKTKVTPDLVLVGKDYNMINRLKRLKKELDGKYGERNVYFLENVERGDVPGIVAGAKLYISSSRWEGYSVSLIEAMALGIPFVSTNVGNARVLPGGIVANDNELHLAIDKVLSDVSLYKELKEAGISFAKKNCTIEEKINEFISILEG